MVFKVKQKSQVTYEDMKVDQASQGSTDLSISTRIKTLAEVTTATDNTYPLQYNWPYDYVSFVESIKFGASVQYKPEIPEIEGVAEATTDTTTETGSTATPGAQDMVSKVSSATGLTKEQITAASSKPGVDSTLFNKVSETTTASKTSAIEGLQEATGGLVAIRGSTATPVTTTTAKPGSTSSIGKSTSTTSTTGATTATATSTSTSAAAVPSGVGKTAAPIKTYGD
jgi:hypothetical protein